MLSPLERNKIRNTFKKLNMLNRFLIAKNLTADELVNLSESEQYQFFNEFQGWKNLPVIEQYEEWRNH